MWCSAAAAHRSLPSPARHALEQDEGLKVCWNTLLKFCGNVAMHPQVSAPRTHQLGALHCWSAAAVGGMGRGAGSHGCRLWAGDCAA